MSHRAPARSMAKSCPAPGPHPRRSATRGLVPALVVAGLWLAAARAGAAVPLAPATPPAAADGLISLASIHSITLRDARGNETKTLAPADTFYADVMVSDLLGFRNVSDLDLDVRLGTSAALGKPTWQLGRFHWERGATPAWSITSTGSTGWRLFPDLCYVDETTNSISPQLVRVAFSPCVVARADTSGWNLKAITGSVSLLATGFAMAERVEWAGLAPGGAFAAGLPGSTDLPLSAPSSGRLAFRLVTNTPVSLSGTTDAFTGRTNPAVRFGGGVADTTVRWLATGVGTPSTGYLDSVSAPLGTAVAALEDTTAAAVAVDLRLALPAGAQAQYYDASLRLAAKSRSRQVTLPLPLVAAVLGNGVAASTAEAEVAPQSVVAGTSAQPMEAKLGFTVQPGETGINRVRIALPSGWSSAAVTGVTDLAGTPVTFHDASTTGAAVAALASTRTTGGLRVQFRADVPTRSDAGGSPFIVYYDDTTTAIAEQVSREGNPDGIPPSGWTVVVGPAAAARLETSPPAASIFVGDSVRFSAVVSDAFGNVRGGDPVAWSEQGGAGVVDASGLYRGSVDGVSLVVAQSGTVADTVQVLVTDPAVSTVVTLAAPAASRLLPGEPPRELARLLLHNPGGLADTVDAVELADVSTGPPTGKQLGDSWNAFELRDSTGRVLATTDWAAGLVRFEGVKLALPAGASRRLSLFGAASVRAHDGDSLGFGLAGDATLSLRSGRPAALGNGAAPTRMVVDGMSAAQVTLLPLATGPIFAGTRRRAVAELHVPANGWAPDRLLRLNLLNQGTAEAGADLTRMEAWLDDGDRTLDTLVDQRLGSLLFTGDRWELTGLAVDVPDSGACLLVSVDVPASARDGRTLRLALPTLPDVGLGMLSTNSGPIDRVVASDHEDVIGGGERVLVTATQITGGKAHPGERGLPVLELVLANGYADARHVRSLLLTHVSTGAGSLSQLDGSVARVALGLAAPASVDGSASVGISTPIASGSFANGRVLFDGFDLEIPAGGELRLVATVDLDANLATDGDRLAVQVASAQDVQIAESGVLAGTWPASSGATWTIDGFVSAQATVRERAGLTLAPGDGPVCALDVRLPGDGYLADVLHGVRVANLGDASATEIAELRLFRDGGDGVLGGPTPDDTDLGPFVPVGGEWQSAYLADPVPVGGARYFVGLTVAGTTSDSSTVRLAIPVAGVEMESANDGPLDQPLGNAESFVLSTRPLLASLTLDGAASTIGQLVDVTLTVRNTGTETFTGVTPGALAFEGTASWQRLSGPSPATADLAPGGSATFTWSVSPTTAGDLQFATTATGTGQTTLLERRTLVAHSGLGRVYMESDSLRLVVQQSMPSSVNRGQAGVVPLTLTLEHPGDASSSAIAFTRLRVRLEQEDGSPIAPADLASAFEVREGTTVYLRRTSLETSGDEVDLALTTPVMLRPGDPVSLALRLDIAAATTVSTFRLVIPDSSVFVAADAISGQPVRVRLQGQSYPVRSGLARVLTGDGAMVLSTPAPVRRTASAGQSAVTLDAWTVAHSSSQSGSADLRLNALWVRAGFPGGPPATLPWTRWRVLANGLVVNVHPVAAGDTGDVRLELVPSPIVQPGGSVALRIVADLDAGSAGSTFQLDGTRFAEWDARDVNTGDPVSLVTSGPADGDSIVVQAPATELDVTPIALMPSLVAAGRAHLPALGVVLRHPGAPGVADIHADSIRVSLHAPDGHLLAMDQYLVTLRLLRRGAVVSAQVAPAAGFAVLSARDTVGAGSRDTLTIEVDVAANAPSGTIGMGIADGGIRAHDGNSDVEVTVLPEPPAAWPFESGLATLVAPARELRVDAGSELPPLVPPSGTALVPAARLVLRHPGPAGAGSITVDHVVVSAADAPGNALALGSVAGALELRLGGTAIAGAPTLTVDSTTATLGFAAPVEIAAGDSLVLELLVRPQASDPATRFRLGWRSDGIGVVQPSSALLAVAVLADPGASFPMWTEAAAFASGDLAASYQNFPNPFAAGRDATTFAWLMPGPGRVTLRIRTPRGEPVVTLLDGAALPAGLRQSDRWDGRNGRGEVVANGVYVAELEVTLDAGGHERVLRKVAVVR